MTTQQQTIEHKHQDGRWVREHFDRDGGITYTSNFDHEAMLRDDRLWQIHGCDDIKHYGNLDGYYTKFTELHRSEVIYLYQQWRDYVQEGHTMASFEQWLEWEINDGDDLYEQRDLAQDTLYDEITECLEREGFN